MELVRMEGKDGYVVHSTSLALRLAVLLRQPVPGPDFPEMLNCTKLRTNYKTAMFEAN